ncbi:MBL fold metallo-hydrolase [Arhodomonas sp. AD133]|uniref:MBL fold metallo-hydrolase n=1 Tax=Arhodomonas sp. AD133 TaxID=3415009 RepID=UPI003EBA1B06
MASHEQRLLPGTPPAALADTLFAVHRRILLFGSPGTGKSTMAAAIARALTAGNRTPACLNADPGEPSFGVPGTIGLGLWEADGWRLETMIPLCTLDAARFRLPLVTAVARLATRVPRHCPVIVDYPGVTRGAAGAELLLSLVETVGVEVVVALVRDDDSMPLADELRDVPATVYRVAAHADARRPPPLARRRHRTALWDAYLRDAATRDMNIADCRLLGTPPPRTAHDAWTGRQVALYHEGALQGMGEVDTLDAGVLRIKTAAEIGGWVDALVVRDAQRGDNGLLETAARRAPRPGLRQQPADVLPSPLEALPVGPRPVVRTGPVVASLVNGVLGDPLLHIRLRRQRRSLFIDLGDPGHLPAKTAHQVTDVFVTHAHFDHIGGFPWLLRSRIGDFPELRLYGPPGLAEHIEGFVRGILWDRVGERAPRMRVTEFDGETVRRFRVVAGRAGPVALDEMPARAGVLLDEAEFRVRARVLDHGTPVLAYAFEPSAQVNVRKERLAARGLEPGPWLGELKQRLLAGESEHIVTLPDGTAEPARRLAEALTITTPGKRIAYATDFAETAENFLRLGELAAGAHVLFCEASFRRVDAAQARRTGHLTTDGCATAARAADPATLVPFHFSRRYEGGLEPVYTEIAAGFPRMAFPTTPGEAPRTGP